jgi:hypothetical protein
VIRRRSLPSPLFNRAKTSCTVVGEYYRAFMARLLVGRLARPELVTVAAVDADARIIQFHRFLTFRFLSTLGIGRKRAKQPAVSDIILILTEV